MSASPPKIGISDELGAQPFLGGAEHLVAEVERLRWILLREVARLRAANLLREDQFRGLYISDEQIDAIVRGSAQPDVANGDRHTSFPEAHSFSVRISGCAQEIAARCTATYESGALLPLDRLATAFSLDGLEREALLFAAAPEIDSSFELLYSYVQNDVTRKRPTVGLLTRLMARDCLESVHLRRLFSPSGALFRAPLLRFFDEAQEREAPLLSRAVRPDERIIDFLLEHDELDSRVRSFTRTVCPARSLKSLHLPSQFAEQLRAALSPVTNAGGVFFFWGPTGTGKTAAAEALSFEAGRSLVTADTRQAGSLDALTALQLFNREAQLRGANLLLRHVDAWFGDDPAQRQRAQSLIQAVFDSMSRQGSTIFITSQTLLQPAAARLSCPWSIFEFPVPAFPDRISLWRDAVESIGATLPHPAASELANRFVLSGGQIEAACNAAAAHAGMSGQDVSRLGVTEFEAEARAQSNRSLQRYAQKVGSVHDWRDLVLPPRTLQQLREVCAAQRYRGTIFCEWEFDRRLMHGKGLNVLFSGPSGTGKTMSAGIVSRELGLDLYKVDLSTVVSKYIGETEKQLSLIFHEAQSSNAILFFDEADAIFGKRSEVKDAHDRYANIEVAYLLQKMEEYEGVVILATNFRKNIDEAFTRRIQYIVEFPFPEPVYRKRLWRNMIPASAPLSDDVDFEFLARQFELAGGNICNAVLVAAYNAAAEGGSIRMEHFVLAVAREMQKLGKLPSRADFREYYEITRERC